MVNIFHLYVRFLNVPPDYLQKAKFKLFFQIYTKNQTIVYKVFLP